MKSSALKSQVSWLTLTQDDIRQAKQIIAMAGPESTVDVLGLGTPVEFISDLLFPGTSTLHTEFRYVIFVSAILYAMKENGGADDPFGLLKRKENELIKSLQKSGLKEGVIGRTRGIDLKYWPSMTYWTAVNTFKSLGPNYYDRAQLLERLQKKSHLRIVSDDGEQADHYQISFVGNDDFAPIARAIFTDFKKITWPEKVDFKLSRAEAKYLKSKIEESYPDSMYVDLLKLPPSKLEKTNSLFEVGKIRSELRDLITECENYSRLSAGATYAYRWALCDHVVKERKLSTKDEWVGYRKRNSELFNEWYSKCTDLKGWKIEQLTSAIVKAFPSANRNLNLFDRSTEKFCNEISQIIFGKGFIHSRLTNAGKLARDREEKLKGNRSRFRDASIEIPDNVKALPETTVGTILYTYRWEWGKDNAFRILEGLGKK